MSANCSRTTVGEERLDRRRAPRRAAPAAGAPDARPCTRRMNSSTSWLARHEHDDEVVVADLPDRLEPRLRPGPTGTGCGAPSPGGGAARAPGPTRCSPGSPGSCGSGSPGRGRGRQKVRFAGSLDDLRHGRLHGRELGRVVALVAEDVEQDREDAVLGLGVPGRGRLGPRRLDGRHLALAVAPRASAAAGRRRPDGAGRRASASAASRTSSSRSGCPRPGSARGRAAARTRESYAPDSTRSRISVPVGALASKSRLTTASSCSRVSRTEKSRSALKLDGKTSRPWPLTTKGLPMVAPAGTPGRPTLT